MYIYIYISLINARTVEHIERHGVPFIVSPNTEDLTAGAGFPPKKSQCSSLGKRTIPVLNVQRTLYRAASENGAKKAMNGQDK